MKMIKALRSRKNKTGKSSAGWGLFKCDICGSEVEKVQSAGRAAFTCGCTTSHHGMSGTMIYSRWHSMKCNSRKRGIALCPQWHDFEPYHAWATENGYKDGMTLRRKNKARGYYPQNCIFKRHNY